MATRELRELRQKYRTAYTGYMHCVQELADASQKGECPADSILIGEEKALADLNTSRTALLSALCRQRKFALP